MHLGVLWFYLLYLVILSEAFPAGPFAGAITGHLRPPDSPASLLPCLSLSPFPCASPGSSPAGQRDVCNPQSDEDLGQEKIASSCRATTPKTSKEEGEAGCLMPHRARAFRAAVGDSHHACTPPKLRRGSCLLPKSHTVTCVS